MHEFSPNLGKEAWGRDGELLQDWKLVILDHGIRHRRSLMMPFIQLTSSPTRRASRLPPWQDI
eukprot:scaffold172633_cov33-Tisochrysis_lutea.AAC.8